ncbi:hypothetical protein GGX14DRAFT_558263 [Mycena pura]|uniref:Uncharacterized protein n=1 Tax=Mycena pura TaxID=153505 RepID=A0AAD6YKC6_9AGAR|nr:hypothetical protein GGX14DRAFT_558263 [Mycena pura]
MSLFSSLFPTTFRPRSLYPFASSHGREDKMQGPSHNRNAVPDAPVPPAGPLQLPACCNCSAACLARPAPQDPPLTASPHCLPLAARRQLPTDRPPQDPLAAACRRLTRCASAARRPTTRPAGCCSPLALVPRYTFPLTVPRCTPAVPRPFSRKTRRLLPNRMPTACCSPPASD